MIKKNFYFVVPKKQTNDISTFCCSGNDLSVLGIDTTYNLCDIRVTDSCYQNKRLISNTSGVHPVCLGLTLLHEDKEQADVYAIFIRNTSVQPISKGNKEDWC